MSDDTQDANTNTPTWKKVLSSLGTWLAVDQTVTAPRWVFVLALLVVAVFSAWFFH